MRHGLSLASMLPFIFHVILYACWCSAYEFVQEYNSLTFFDKWDFSSGGDAFTSGNVNWVDQGTAFNDHLAFVNGNYNVVIRVDNGYVPFGANRNSVRITAQDPFYVGTLIIADMVHLPYGCSVWPAFWSTGPTWPDNGEIDIIEQINLATRNQMALHSLPGCFQSVPSFQTGFSGGQLHTGDDCSTPAGCVVEDSSPVSFGAGFAAAGGGVWAAQFDVSGVFIWFWSRANIPPALTATVNGGAGPMELKTWGPPSAAYMATGCNITEFFAPQHLILDIDLCGWAADPFQYNLTCGPGRCYDNNVPGSGSNYDEAYFEIKYIRQYTTGGPVPLPTPAQVGAVWNTATASAASTTVTAFGTLHASPTAKSSAPRSSTPTFAILFAILASIMGAVMTFTRLH